MRFPWLNGAATTSVAQCLRHAQGRGDRPPDPHGARAGHRALHRDDRRPQLLHYDEGKASRSRFGGLIVQGGITSGLLNAVVAQELPGPGSVFLHVDWSFKAPVRPGDEITAEVEVLETRQDKPLRASDDDHEPDGDGGARRQRARLDRASLSLVLERGSVIDSRRKGHLARHERRERHGLPA
jgi:MaoC like domain